MIQYSSSSNNNNNSYATNNSSTLKVMYCTHNVIKVVTDSSQFK